MTTGEVRVPVGPIRYTIREQELMGLEKAFARHKALVMTGVVASAIALLQGAYKVYSYTSASSMNSKERIEAMRITPFEFLPIAIAIVCGTAALIVSRTLKEKQRKLM